MFYSHGIVTEKLVSLFMMRWIHDNLPEIAEKTEKMLHISDFVNMKLTGALVTDYTHAATTGVFNPIIGEWNSEYLKWAGFQPKNMPEAVLAGTPIGKITSQAASETGLSEDVLVVAGAHDNECAAFALGMRDDDTVYNICGTWDIILSLHHQPNFDEGRASRGIKVVRYIIPETYASLKYGIAGSFLEWAKDNFFGSELEMAIKSGKSVWDIILHQTNEIPPLSNGILALPFRAGAGGKDRNQFAAGTIMGIDSYLGKADVMHSLFECLGYQTLDFIESMEAVSGKSYQQIVSVGGTVRNQQLMQIKADICNREVSVMNISEGTALGAAMLAGIGARFYADCYDAMEQTGSHLEHTEYYPNAQNVVLYQEGYQKYKKSGELLNQI